LLSLNISMLHINLFMLILVRVAAIIMAIPVLNSKNIPHLFKAGLVVAVSMILFPLLEPHAPPPATALLPFAIGIVGEITMGIIIGLSVNLVFAGVQLAGQLAGFQMGFAIANVMDPTTSSQIPILAQFNNIFAILIFLSLNIHHILINAMFESFQLVPFFSFNFSGALMDQVMILVKNMFVTGIKIGAPIVAVMLITTVALGVIARTVPQMHIFIVAMPLKIMIGMVFIVIVTPYMLEALTGIFHDLGNTVYNLMKLM